MKTINKNEYTALNDNEQKKSISSVQLVKSIVIILSLLSLTLLIDNKPPSFNYNVLENIHVQLDYDTIGVPTLHPSKDHLHVGSKSMVTSDVPICSQMGRDILLKGGNAADAAVTVALCIGSVNSHSSGIGGGGYIVSSYMETGEVLSIDAREIAPAGAFKHMFARSELLSKFGGLAVAVPGELKGLYELFVRHGSGNLSWYEIFEPVINLNRNGFRCSFILARAIEMTKSRIFSLAPQLEESWDYIYKNGTKDLVQEGDLIKRVAFANTLESIAKNGSADIFYDPEGPIVSALIEKSQSLGGVISKEDFTKYEVNVEPALFLNLKIHDKNHKVFTTGGVSSGLALLAGLNLFNKIYNESNSDVLESHKIIESMKWMASARSHFGDFSLHGNNSTYRKILEDKFLSDEWANDIVKSGNYSDFTTFPWEHYQPKYELTEPHGTAHFSVVDENGNSVGMTTTVNLLFGSLVYDNRTGVILNDQMDDFSVPNTPNAFNISPSAFNFIEPFKRPLSSTSPSLIFTESSPGSFYPDLLIGSAGGSRIPTAIFQAIVRVLYNNLSLLEAISFPRLHHQLMPNVLMVENFTIFEQEHNQYSTYNISGLLQNLGHDLVETGSATAMNAIKRKLQDSGEYVWEGVGDYWRKLGEASGY